MRAHVTQPAQDTHKFGARIRALREAGGLTQAQLADAASIAPETLSRIERGRLRPSLRLVAQLATALSANPNDIYEPTTVPPPAPDLRPVDRKLLYEVREMPEEVVEGLIRVVRLLIDIGRKIPAK